MRKLLLSFSMIGLMTAGYSQVIFYVEVPAPLEGNYDMTWGDPAGGWGTADLNIPANSVTDTLMFVDDGTAADSLGCGVLVNSLAGKIAVVYRGDCEFGAKALRAQNAGAVGVVIINNIPGAPIAIGAGASGASVTIPTVMITDIAGAALRQQIINGNVRAFIGSKFGYYPNDIGFAPKDVLVAPASSNPSLTSGVAADFSASLGGWVYNYGTNAQTGITVTARVNYGGTDIYTQTSTSFSLPAGDSLFVTLPAFSAATYANGLYKLIYTTSFAGTDQFLADNTLRRDFAISDSIFSYGLIDTVSLQATTSASYRPAAGTGDFFSCVVFSDDHASRLAVQGMYFTASTNVADSLNGAFIETVLYKWNDVFTDLNDAAASITDIEPIAYGDYTYPSNQQNVAIYTALIPASGPDQYVILEDAQRYLFCVQTAETRVYLGYSTALDYDENVNEYLQPLFPTKNDNTWFLLGFGTEIVPTTRVKFLDAVTFGTEEESQLNNITPYPNPASNVVYIPLKDVLGNATIEVLDMNGKVLKAEVRNLTSSIQLPVNIEGLSNGQYLIRLVTENDGSITFKLLVNN